MFLGYIHYFRALAILFIITGHTIDAFVWENESTEKLLRIFLSNGSVLFVFIAGYLFQHLSSKYEFKKYIKSKVTNVLVPYFVISLPAIVIFVTFLQRENMWEGFYDYSLIQQVGYFYLTGFHLAPLWFIPMISLFYLAAPLLIKADKNKIIYLTLPIFILVSCLVDRGMPYQSFLHFFSAYLLGMCCSHYKDLLNGIISRTLALSILLLFAVGLAWYEYLYMNGTMTYINFLQKLCCSIFFLGLFFKNNAKLNSKYIGTIADTSFGVFFIHSYILTAGKLTYSYLHGTPPSGNILAYIIVALLTLVVCSFGITLIQKLFGRKSKLIVGS